MIALSVKDLQELLMNNRDISENCFNLGVRFQAAREYNTMKKYNSITKHHMDLRFYVSTFLKFLSCYIVFSYLLFS